MQNNFGKHKLTQISDKVYAPIEWLNTLIPHELRLLPNPYKELPYLYFKVALDTKPLYKSAISQKPEAQKIGIISTKDGIVRPKAKKDIRNTYNITADAGFMQLYSEIFSLHKAKIESFFNVSIIASGDPQILIYSPGCFYVRHSDNCTELLKDGKLVGFKPVASHRVITTVLFLNDCVTKDPQADEYSGGKLRFDFFFNEQNEVVTLLPQGGYMISFLSNPFYSHSVTPVTKGVRISVAQWHNAIAH